MNIAFPAILLFALLLPGFVFRTRFKRAERTSLDYAPFGQVVTESVQISFFLHLVWLLFSYSLFGSTLNIQSLLALSGADPKAQSVAFADVARSWRDVALYFSTLIILCWITPRVFREIVSRMKWDRVGLWSSSLLRFHDAPWYYLLTGADFPKGKEPDLIFVSAIVDIGSSEPVLYTGVLDEYFVDSDGTLNRLVLSQAFRRSIKDDRSGGESATNKSNLDRFYRIAGDYFVLRYSEIITLNISYVALQQETVS